MASGLNFFTNAIDVTPGVGEGTWQDVDVSAHIPVGATGVILDIDNDRAGSSQRQVRKNGSTDAFQANSDLDEDSHFGVIIGVDANRVFEVWIEHVGTGKIWLMGYTDSNCVLDTNMTIKALGAGDLSAWTDIDLSGEIVAGATGAIMVIISAAGALQGTVRKNGSTDARTARADIMNVGSIYAVVGVDASRICEGWIESTDVDHYVVGSVSAPVVMNTNADDVSGGTASAWTDKDVTAETSADCDGVILEFYNESATGYTQSARKDGSGDNRIADIYIGARRHNWFFVGVSGAQIFEQYINNLASDCYLMGYAEPAAVVATAPFSNLPIAPMLAGG